MPRLFLDLFAGKLAPCLQQPKNCTSTASSPLMQQAIHSTTCSMTFFTILQRLCWSGLVCFIWSAPPCSEYSRLKLRQPGPKPLRTPEHMEGVPGLSQQEQQRVDNSAEIHARSRALIRAATAKGADGGFEQPVDAISWLVPDNIQLLRELNATCAHVAACAHNLGLGNLGSMLRQTRSGISCSSMHACARHTPVLAQQARRIGSFHQLAKR